MKKILIALLGLLLLSSSQTKGIARRLDPNSFREQLAFYQLYPETEEGKRALKHAWRLLSKSDQTTQETISLPNLEAFQGIITLVNKSPDRKKSPLRKEELALTAEFGRSLWNRTLKGHSVHSVEEVLQLPPEEIDLARGLMLSLDPPLSLEEIQSYEAELDLMALQIQARLSDHPTAEEMIREMNRFVFEEMAFAFPPHSAFAKDIDLYTFLPNVLDSRRGVCLGVSIVYLCLSERLGIPLEIITPPGHIYVRYKDINIETTARGIHIDDDEYLGINNRKLKERSRKETIGFAHMNQASTYLSSGEFGKAKAAYERALKFIPDDPLLTELYAYSLLLTGEKKKGITVLQKVASVIADESVAPEPIAADFIKKKMDEECLKTLFLMVDEDRASLLRKEELLEKQLQKFPYFRAGLQSLATTLLQLHREGAALEVLKRYHDIDKSNPTVEYMLAVLSAKRVDYTRAVEHLKLAEQIVEARGANPKALREFKKQLRVVYPYE